MLADLGTPIATQTIAAALAWAPERVRAAAAQLRHELQRLGQTVTLSPGDQLGLAPFATCISDEQRAAVRREALTIDHATAHMLLAVLRGRRDERSWNKLDDNQRVIAGERSIAVIVPVVSLSQTRQTATPWPQPTSSRRSAGRTWSVSTAQANRCDALPAMPEQ